MGRTTVLLCCALLPLGLAACGDDNDGGGTKTQTVRITERDTDDFGYNDVPPKTTMGDQGPEKMSAGDVLSFRSDLIREGKDVGDLLATCTVISGTDFRNAGVSCTGIYQLPEGTLTAQVGGAGVLGGKMTNGTITGGTGKYAGATGTFSSPNGNGDVTTTMKLRVPKD